jgi:MFS family permease
VVVVDGPGDGEPAAAEEPSARAASAHRGDAVFEPAARDAATARPFGARFVAPILVGSTLNPINTSSIATALVGIATTMHVPVGKTSVLISSLYVACAIAQPTAGRLAEEFGPRRVFLVGTVLVLIAGLWGAVVGSLATLVWVRVLIGVGTSAAYPTAMLLIRRRAADVGLRSPPSTVLGAIAIAGAATAAIGPSVGGLLVGWFGWRAVFVVNVPFACVAAIMALRWIPRDPAPPHHRPWPVMMSRLDLPGMATFGAALICTLVTVTTLPRPSLLAVAGTVGFWVLLVWRELRAAYPFIDVRLLARSGALSRTYVRSALSVFGIYVVMYGMTQWLQADQGQSAFAAGLILLPLGALSALTARAVSGRTSPRMPLNVAAVVLVVGSVLLAMLSKATPLVGIVAVTAMFGVMNGASTVGNQLALYRQAPAETIGTASGLLRTFTYLGSIASAVIIGSAYRHSVDISGLHRMGLILTAVGVVLLLMTVCDRRLCSPGAEHNI